MANKKSASNTDGAENAPKVDVKQEAKVISIDIPRNGGKLEYTVPSDEMEHTAHVFQEQIRFDGQTGKRMSVGYVQKYDRQGWDNFRQYGLSQGWTIVPIYLPEGWDSEVKRLESVGKKVNQR